MDARLLAHVKWYVEEPAAPVDLDFVLDPASVVLIVAAIAIACVWRMVARRLPEPEISALQSFGNLAPWVPRLLAIHLGVALLSLAVADAYLSPNLPLEGVQGGGVLALGQAVVGVWLITGVRVRSAAVLVIVLGPLGLLLEGPLPVLESANLLGLAGFLAILPPGRDDHGARTVERDELAIPVLLLRLAVGSALIVLAFSEKLLVPDLMRTLLDARPGLDPLQQLGVATGPDAFIRLAAATEVLIGLLIISGAAPQLVVLVAAVPFNLTLVFFDRLELIGHLPIYGALLALLVYGSNPGLASVVPSFDLTAADRHGRLARAFRWGRSPRSRGNGPARR
jgi:hypothetical protein